MIPCPVCSAISGDGAPLDVRPTWFHARGTSQKTGRQHWVWGGCEHAMTVSPEIPVDNRAMTEARWDVEARRLLALKTANMTEEVRNQFKKVLGF